MKSNYYQTVVSNNQIKFEPYIHLVDEPYSRYNAWQYTFDQIENDETGETVYSKDQDGGNTVSNRNCAVPNFMSRIMADDETLEVSIL